MITSHPHNARYYNIKIITKRDNHALSGTLSGTLYEPVLYLLEQMDLKKIIESEIASLDFSIFKTPRIRNINSKIYNNELCVEMWIFNNYD